MKVARPEGVEPPTLCLEERRVVAESNLTCLSSLAYRHVGKDESKRRRTKMHELC